VIRRLHHVGVLTSDIDAMLSHYVALLGVERPAITVVDRADLRLRTTMVATGPDATTYLQLIEPAVGPGVAELARGGDGTLFEIAFEVDGLADVTASLRDQGIEPEDFVGQPLEGPFATAASGNRFAYLPIAATRGTRTELIEPTSRPDGAGPGGNER
jgi:catechol 2,3-dioxygenase-like lactoylglutathione lyase family enzyme